MLKTLQRLFSSKSHDEKKELTVKELSVWMEEYAKKQGILNSLNGYFDKLKYLIEDLKQNIEALRNQEVLEKDKKGLDKRVELSVKGHRDNYVKELELFAHNIPTYPENNNIINYLEQTFNFNATINHKLDDLAKRSAKNHHAAQHLFFEQVDNIYKNLGEINLLVKNLDKILGKKSLQFIEIQQGIKEFNDSLDKMKIIEDNIKELEHEKSGLIEEKNKEIIKLDKQLNSEDYLQYRNLEKELDSLNKEIVDNQNHIQLFFIKLNKPLKKFYYYNHEYKIIENYLDDSISTLINDTNLKIIEILNKLELEIDKLKLDEKSRQQTIELIDNAKSGALKDLKSISINLACKKEELINKIDKNEAKINVKHLQDEIALLENNIEQKEKNVEKLKNKIEQNDNVNIKTKIEERIYYLSNVKIIIKH